ncbi:hypothetical protein B0T14DRAFT_527527 [Immersiella caudata]|uniref:Uncharacterized protein n=1 Tax=Immersiella caudata TaxID=314043 RepID=A0AA39WER3_9PEZI|nr:hypothetical protein B0T14DRAFT_527527 [Immersiella caudata]
MGLFGSVTVAVRALGAVLLAHAAGAGFAAVIAALVAAVGAALTLGAGAAFLLVIVVVHLGLIYLLLAMGRLVLPVRVVLPVVVLVPRLVAVQAVVLGLAVQGRGGHVDGIRLADLDGAGGRRGRQAVAVVVGAVVVAGAGLLAVDGRGGRVAVVGVARVAVAGGSVAVGVGTGRGAVSGVELQGLTGVEVGAALVVGVRA